MRTGTGRTNSWELAFTLLDKLEAYWLDIFIIAGN